MEDATVYCYHVSEAGTYDTANGSQQVSNAFLEVIDGDHSEADSSYATAPDTTSFVTERRKIMSNTSNTPQVENLENNEQKQTYQMEEDFSNDSVLSAYYSSDDEIAWGPLTLREIRRYLRHQPKKITKRESDFGYYTSPSCNVLFNKNHSDSEIMHKKLQQYGLDESLQEKVAEVIGTDSVEINSSNPIHTTAINTSSSNIKKRDVILDIATSKHVEDLQNIKQTPVENTIYLSLNENGGQEHAICIYEEISDDCIVISDDSLQESDKGVVNEEQHSKKAFEDENVSFRESFESDLVLDDCTLEESFSESNLSHDRSKESQMSRQTLLESWTYRNEQEKYKRNNKNCERNQAIEEITSQFQSIKLNISGVYSMSEESIKSDYETSRSFPLEEFRNDVRYQEENLNSNGETSKNVSIKDESYLLNDTSEEMGLKGDAHHHEKIFRLPSPGKVPKLTVPTCLVKKTLRNFDYLRSPVAEYIHKKSPPNMFKLPIKTLNTGKTPNTKYTLTQPKKFKNIQSPVGIYIKNGPQACLHTKVIANTVTRPITEENLNSPTINQEESIVLSLPKVIYKPPKNVIAVVKKDPVLPGSIEKLVYVPTITIHEKRTKKNQEWQFDKLEVLEDDLTTASIDCSSVDQTSADIDVVTVQKAYIE